MQQTGEGSLKPKPTPIQADRYQGWQDLPSSAPTDAPMYSINATFDDASNIILVTLSGKIDLAAIQESRSITMQLVLKHNCVRVLADLRQTVSDVSTADIYFQPQQMQDRVDREGLAITDFRRAIVVSDANPDSQFFETVAKNLGQSVRLFHSIDEAKQWLTGTRGPGAPNR